jgi:mannose-6-phosphate isomerase-like protein (cupin superfamily)
MLKAWSVNPVNSFFDENATGTLQSISVSALSFNLRRIYWICLNDKGWRGFHAHKELQQVLFVQSGHLEIHLDDGKETETVELGPSQSILILPRVWRKFKSLSEESILLVLASEDFSDEDYIRDFEEFRTYVNGLF